MLWSKIKTPLSFLAIGISLVVIILVSYTNLQALGRGRIKALDNDARARLSAAVRDMRRRGIRPRINSAFRSHSEQRAIYRCARSRRCRARRGIYGAKPPGTSVPEAGLAVDIGSGVRPPRLTPSGREAWRPDTGADASRPEG